MTNINEVSFYGKPVKTMNRENLMQMATFLLEENARLRTAMGLEPRSHIIHMERVQPTNNKNTKTPEGETIRGPFGMGFKY